MVARLSAAVALVLCAASATAESVFRLDCLSGGSAVCTDRSVTVTEPNGSTPSLFTVRVTADPPISGAGYVQIRLQLSPSTTTPGASSDDVRTWPGTAVYSTGVMTAISSTFDATFGVMPDIIPELAESFNIVLTFDFVSADLNVSINTSASSLSAVVPPNGVPYGMFGFTSYATVLSASEGSSVVVSVTRQQGSFLRVEIDVQLNFTGTATAADIGAPLNTSLVGRLTFAEGVTTQLLIVPITADGVPELAERFVAWLRNATVYDDMNAVVATTGLIDRQRSAQTIEIAESDYPYGLFQFQQVRLQHVHTIAILLMSSLGLFYFFWLWAGSTRVVCRISSFLCLRAALCLLRSPTLDRCI
jgi:hypothetical protein